MTLAANDAVFVGTPESYRETENDWGHTIGHWTVRIHRAWKGALRREQATVLGNLSVSEAPQLTLHQAYLFTVYDTSNEAWIVGRCSVRELESHDAAIPDLPSAPVDRSRPGGHEAPTTAENVDTVRRSADGAARLLAWGQLSAGDLAPDELLRLVQTSETERSTAELLTILELLDETLDGDIAAALPYLRAAYFGPDSRVAQRALGILGGGRPSPGLLDLLRDAIHGAEDKRYLLRLWASKHPRPADAHDLLGEILGNGTLLDKGHAVRALLDLKQTPPEWVPMLFELARQQHAAGEIPFAAWTLGYAGPDAALPLSELLRSTDEKLREAASFGLLYLGSEGGAVLDRLNTAMDDPDWTVRRNIAAAIERIEPGSGWTWYRTWQDSGSSTERYAAMEFLRALENEAAIAELVSLLDRDDRQESAMNILHDAGARAEPALPRLRALAVGDSDRSRRARRTIRAIEADLARGDTGSRSSE
ncbi:hypothetical protein ABI59_02160 [Acidobacteria bacterium Mor1]|nr:hypothetical protein ABI59_02160 [Acidobacteria bacterium Mor1]